MNPGFGRWRLDDGRLNCLWSVGQFSPHFRPQPSDIRRRPIEDPIIDCSASASTRAASRFHNTTYSGLALAGSLVYHPTSRKTGLGAARFAPSSRLPHFSYGGGLGIGWTRGGGLADDGVAYVCMPATLNPMV